MNSHVSDTVHDTKQQLKGLIILRAQDNRGIVAPDLAPDLPRVAGEREQVRAGGVEVLGGVTELLAQRGDDPVVLRVHGVGVGLVEDGAHLGGHVRLRGARHAGKQVAQVVCP